MKMKKKIRANMNPEVEINESDRNCYHLRWTYVKINPADPTHPETKTEVRALRTVDYHKFFEGDTDKMLKMQKTVGVEKVELVHDPTLPPREVKGITEVDPQSFTKFEPVEVQETNKEESEKVESIEDKTKQARENELGHIEKRNAIPRSARKKAKK